VVSVVAQRVELRVHTSIPSLAVSLVGEWRRAVDDAVEHVELVRELVEHHVATRAAGAAPPSAPRATTAAPGRGDAPPVELRRARSRRRLGVSVRVPWNVIVAGGR
jgi:hypothetical protein